MKAKIIKNPFEEWERIEFPTFRKGTEVVMIKASEHFNWYEAEIKDKEIFVPKHFVNDNKLNRDYNPTELDSKIGDVIDIKEVHTLWLLAEDTQGNAGWILAENVISG